MAYVYVNMDSLLSFQQQLETTLQPLAPQLSCKEELIEKTRKILVEAVARAAAAERVSQQALFLAQDSLRAAEQRTRDYNSHLGEGQSPITTPDFYYAAVEDRELDLHLAEGGRRNAENTLDDFDQYVAQYHRAQEESQLHYKNLLSKSGDFFTKYIEKLVDVKTMTALVSGTAVGAQAGNNPVQNSAGEQESNLANDPLSKVLTGFPRISGSHSMVDDLAATNPNYSLEDPDSPWDVNCQRCISAYEARRRGYNVEAKPAPQGWDCLSIMCHPNGWPTVYEGYRLIDCSANSGTAAGDNVEQLVESWGEDARAIVRVRWKSGGGHVFIAERINGVTHFVDPQSGEKDVRSYFQFAKGKDVYCMRIDNLPFTDKVLQCCAGR